MTLTQEQLEWIVSEVVRRLREGAPTNAGQAATPSGTTLTLTERLVTLETLRGRLNGVTELRVIARAIVTPAVVDLLKEEQVRLVRGGSNQQTKS